MRWTFALLLAPALALPGAAALGVTQLTLAVEVDAPFVAPVAIVVEDPVATLARAAIATAHEPRAPPPPIGAPTPAIDMALGAPTIEVTLAPPRMLESHVPAGKIERLERAAAPLPARAPLLAPRALDAPPATRPLPTNEATPARVLSDTPTSTPAPRPLARSAPEPAPPPAPERERWPTLAAAGAALILLPLAALLYHRLRGPAVVAGSRQAILDALAAAPGASAAELARAVALDATTVAYHLRRLAREGLIVAEGNPRAPRWFAAGAQDAATRARTLAQRSGGALLEAIRREPGCDKTALAGRLAISRAAVSWHLGALERAGLVRYERAGRRVRVYPTSF